MANKRMIVLAGVLLAAAAALAIVAYIWADGSTAALAPGRYAFIEHYTETRAEIAGQPGTDAYVYLGYPTYNATQTRALAAASLFPPINDSLKAIYQEGSGVGAAGCHGAQMSLYGVYALPFELNGLHLAGVSPDGSARLVYNGQALSLKAGETWYNNRSLVDEVNYTNVTGTWTIEVNLTITERISNFGVFGEAS